MNLFKPKTQSFETPVPQAVAPAPTIDEAMTRTDFMDRLRRRRGAASTILVPGPGQMNALGSGGAGTATLLG